VALQRGHPRELPVHLVEELGVLDGERRLVEQGADDLDVFGRQRLAVVPQRAQDEADPLAAHQERKGVAVADDVELLLDAGRLARQADRREGLELALPEAVAQRGERRGARYAGVRSDRHQRRSLEQQQIGALDVERLLGLGEQHLTEPVEIALLRRSCATRAGRGEAPQRAV
jgi:hypothetical protein